MVVVASAFQQRRLGASTKVNDSQKLLKVFEEGVERIEKDEKKMGSVRRVKSSESSLKRGRDGKEWKWQKR